jgi:tetratricopeptide (TPR) repeat protein
MPQEKAAALTIPQAMDQAAAAYAAGRLEPAAELCRAVLGADPRHLDATNLLGALALAQGDPARAAQHFAAAVKIAPSFAEGFNNLGVALLRMGRHDEALKSFKRAEDRKPGYADAIFNRGLVYAGLKQWREAVATYQRVLALNPSHAGAHNNCGNALLKLARWQEALGHYDAALQLRPDYAEAFCNRTLALKELRRFDEALQSCGRALALRPRYAEALNFRGTVHHDLRQWDEALASYRQAIDARPGYAEPHLNQGVLHLLRGEFAEGWPLHEWRWQIEDAPPLPVFSQPRWTGREDLAAKTILIHAEQGYGDTIHYCRYVPLVQARGAKVVFSVPPSLTTLMQGLSPDVEIVPIGAALPPFDYHCPLMSMPLAFATTLESIPPPAPLRPSPRRVDEWANRLGPRTKPRIGIAWSGNRAHRNDHNRSIELARFEPLLDARFEFHCLQRDIEPAERARLAQHANVRLWEGELRDFEDSAALIDAMDQVVCVDTSIAHLAATLGKPTSILLACLPDHRWLLDRAHSPWYPSARLFRQRAHGDWATVIAEARAAIC